MDLETRTENLAHNEILGNQSALVEALMANDPRMMDELVTPGSVVEVTLTTGDIAHRFATGHRIELAVTSSNFPAWERNLNNGLSSFSADSFQVVTNAVFGDVDFPSRLILPVVPPL